jgi:hypothetical protein
MIWSARSSSVCGIVSPRALAVLRLITNSNLVGCSTGRSEGFAPLRILSMHGNASKQIGEAYPIGHQPAGIDNNPLTEHRRQVVLGREAHD